MNRRAVLLGLVGVAVLIGGVTALALTDDDPTVRTLDVTTTTAPTTSSTTSTTTVPEPEPLSPAVPLTHVGVGPVEVGMTIEQIEAVTGRSITLFSTDTFGGRCYHAEIDGVPGLRLWVSHTMAIDDPGYDPKRGVVGPIEAYESPWRTEAGLGIGPATHDEIQAHYPNAVREGHAYVEGGTFWYDTNADGAVLSVNEYDGVVHSLWAGRLLIEGCA